jgi:long-chain acyl-CoA synthetase
VLEFGIPALIEIPDDAGLADVVFSRAAADPDEVMLRRRGADGGWQDVTAGQFRGQVSALAKGLIAAGIQPGDRVAVMSHTRYEWTLADYAIWTAGAVSVPVYETSSAEQVEWIIGDSGARAAIAESDDHARIIDSVRGRAPGLGPLWRIEKLD